MMASAMLRTVYVSCVDENGNDVLADSSVVRTVKALGEGSESELKTSVVKIAVDSSSLTGGGHRYSATVTDSEVVGATGLSI